MSESMGPLTYGKRDEQIFLGRDISKSQDYSEDTAIKIDQEVKKLVLENYDRAHAVLSENKTILLRIADELLAREVLDADQVTRLAAGQTLEEPLPPARDAGADSPRREVPERPGIVPSLGKPIAQE
jgi:cell division protease FtsH